MPIDKTPWTDDTVMPWGAHKGTKLADVPEGYLLWLLEQSWLKEAWPGLYTYVHSREDDLRSDVQQRDEEVGGYTSYEEFREDFRGF